jgi:hypothetical protein
MYQKKKKRKKKEEKKKKQNVIRTDVIMEAAARLRLECGS